MQRGRAARGSFDALFDRKATAGRA